MVMSSEPVVLDIGYSRDIVVDNMTGTAAAAAAASADPSTKSMELELPSNRFALEVNIFV